MARDITGFPTLPDSKDQYYTNFKIKYISGIITSDGTFSVGTSGVSISAASYSSSTRGTGATAPFPGKLPCDRTWKIKDDEGNDWYVPLFKYG